MIQEIKYFDKPVDYDRRGYNGGELAYYPGNDRLISGFMDNKDYYFQLTAIPDEKYGFISSRLVTKDTFAFKPPFRIKYSAYWRHASMAFYCPVWIFPLNRNLVCEFDSVEWHGGYPDYLLYSFHHTGSKCRVKEVGERPYDHVKISTTDKKTLSYPQDTFELTVYDNIAIWKRNNKRVKIRFCRGLDMEYYLRSTVQVASWAKNSNLPEITKIRPALMQVHNLKFEQL